MAVVRSVKDSLVTTQIENSQGFGKNDSSKESKASKKLENKQIRGFFLWTFIATTIEELRKSYWPSFGYVVRWSVIIVIFTGIFSVSLGFFDNVFNSGVRFIDCTSAKSRNQNLQDCSRELAQKLTYR